jgi:hypothetical protein
MKAIHGGQANHDTLDAPPIAGLLRGGMLPQASVSPRERRATRDRLRRRTPLARQCGALLAPVHTPHSPEHRPAIGQTIASQAKRDGVTARWTDPAVHKSLAVDRARLGDDEAGRRALERTLVRAAKPHDAKTW